MDLKIWSKTFRVSGSSPQKKCKTRHLDGQRRGWDLWACGGWIDRLDGRHAAWSCGLPVAELGAKSAELNLQLKVGLKMLPSLSFNLTP